MQICGLNIRYRVEGFGLADFPELQQKQRQQLVDEVNAFLAIAKEVPADKPASKEQSDDARTHLLRIIEIVGGLLRTEWLSNEAACSLKKRVIQRKRTDGTSSSTKRRLFETLLGEYKAPRGLLITTENNRQILSRSYSTVRQWSTRNRQLGCDAKL